jgi:hypothetical protein
MSTGGGGGTEDVELYEDGTNPCDVAVKLEDVDEGGGPGLYPPISIPSGVEML